MAPTICETWEEKNKRLKREGAISNPLPGEEVCITGMAGRFPESDDISQLYHNLINKVDMITCDNRRWKPTNPKIPHHMGKINHLQKFDAGFFGLRSKLAEMMDPLCRIILERAVEAIMDAGYHPDDLQESRTGVFTSVIFSETQRTWLFEKQQSPNYAILGCSGFAIPQWISYSLGLKGPSFNVDTACSGSFYAIHHAYRAIRSGQCDMALVGSSTLCLHPLTSFQFANLGCVTFDGSCKSFDSAANGYVRSETVSVVILQRAKDAKRIYAKIVHEKVNCDGFKEEGITCPSSEMQKQLLNELYEECGVNPATVDYVEAHATGTKIGDLPEMVALDKVFCAGRTSPLHVGCVKSNLGHAEISSGMCALVKALLSIENNCFLPNLHYNCPKNEFEALKEGRMQVVTDVIPWPTNGSGLCAINNMGFGGANAHILLRCPIKKKLDGGLPRDDLPRLVCLSGRTKEAVTYVCDDVARRTLDVEFVRLLQDVFRRNIQQHSYRGYILMSKKGELGRSVEWFGGELKPVCLVFGFPDEQWIHKGKELLAVPLISETLKKIHHILEAKDVDVLQIINCATVNQDISNVIVGNASLQIALIDTLKSLQFSFDYLLGYSIGELIVAYAKGILTLEQTVLEVYKAANCLSKLLSDSKLPNSNCSDKSKHEDNFSATFQGTRELKRIIEEPRRWSSSGYHNEEHSTFNVLEYVAAEDLMNSMFNSVLFQERLSALPSKIAFVGIGAHCIKLNGTKVVDLISSENAAQNSVNALFRSFGRMYCCGYNMHIDKLYPQIDWPVSRGTAMVSPLVKWDYSHDWCVAPYTKNLIPQGDEHLVTLQLKNPEWKYIAGHVVDGQNLVPAAAYLFVVWQIYSSKLGLSLSETSAVFEHVKFHESVCMSKDGEVKLHVFVHHNTGNFEVAKLGQSLASGRIYTPSYSYQAEMGLPAQDSEASPVSLTERDVYKEFTLRGYNFAGEFRAILECNLSVSRGSLKWTGNWVTFLESMLQMLLLQEPTRDLRLLDEIEYLAINAKYHAQHAEEQPTNIIPAYVYTGANLIRAGAVELRKATFTSAPRVEQKQPVLETYKFIPLEADLATEEAVRVSMQLFLESSHGIKVRVVEVVDEAIGEDFLPLSCLVYQFLNEEPLIKAEIIMLSKQTANLPNITVENRTLSKENSSCSIVIVSKIFSRPKTQRLATAALKENGIIISRETLDFQSDDASLPGLEIFAAYRTSKETLVLMRKSAEFAAPLLVDMSKSAGSLGWLPELQAAMANGRKVILFAQDDPLSGLLGFYTCIKQEPGGFNVKCVLVMDGRAPKFDITDHFYARQLKKGLTVNVLKDGKWGTYRHLKISEEETKICKHVTMSPKPVLVPNRSVIHVNYAAIHNPDFMIGSGQIIKHEVEGFEFSGTDNNWKRKMGIMTGEAVSSMVIADDLLTYDIPDNWTMEEAATVPLAYKTALFSLITIGKLKIGQSILIHEGSSSIGQAAINIASHYKCNIFTTASTQAMRDFLRDEFPKIPETNIGSSQDIPFEQVVMKKTNGLGVDMVLNNLAEGKLPASLRCLAPGGYFLELGISRLKNNWFGLKNLQNSRSFYGVALPISYVTLDLHNLIVKGIEQGYVKPLNRRMIFEKDGVDCPATTKDAEKVMIKMHAGEPETPHKISSFRADPKNSYIIVGGLGGFGLELANWMIIRGARKLILVSRTGVKEGFQAYRIRFWKACGVLVKISTDGATTKEGCEAIIRNASALGPVEGIFNLAAVLKDALLENQNENTFKAPLAPKAIATQHLDEVSREACASLKYFVVFSSIVSGRGNVGQTNYGMGNSTAERICERRRTDGLPAVAIQWGAIKEVGLAAHIEEMETGVGVSGLLKQSVASCLDAMDTFLMQDEPVVASMVVAKKREGKENKRSLVDSVKNIMGYCDLKTISLRLTLPELGMDSIIATEVQQTLEREYEVFLTLNAIRSLTFERLQEMSNKTVEGDVSTTSKPKQQEFHSCNFLKFSIIDKETSDTPITILKPLMKNDVKLDNVFVLPGIEGTASTAEALTRNLSSPTFCLQYPFIYLEEFTIEELARFLLSNIREHISSTTSFTLVGYSYGTLIALELAALLEAEGYFSKIVLIDGSPVMIKQLLKQQFPESEYDDQLQSAVVCSVMQLVLPTANLIQLKKDVQHCETFEDRITEGIKLVKDCKTEHSEAFLRRTCEVFYWRLKSILCYQPKFQKLKSVAKLVKPSEATLGSPDDDYKLQNLFENAVEIKVFRGNHLTILENREVASWIDTL